MHILGNKSDVLMRAPFFEEIQGEALHALQSEKAVALGEIAAKLVPLVEATIPLGINKHDELVMPKVVNPDRPTCFISLADDTRIIEPGVKFIGGSILGFDFNIYTTKSINKRIHLPHLRTVEYPAQKLKLGTHIILPPYEETNNGVTLIHEVEHWRFYMNGEYLEFDSFDESEASTEKQAYRLSHELGTPVKNIPSPEAIMKRLRKLKVIDPVKGAKIASKMVYDRLHTVNGASVVGSEMMAIALSNYFGDGTIRPTKDEIAAFKEANIIGSFIPTEGL